MSSQSRHELKKLQEIWYGKIKEIDPEWEDIEDTRKEERPLKRWHSFDLIRCRISAEEIEEITNYHRAASALLHTYTFRNETYKRIWELHCDGLSKRAIEKAIMDFEKPLKREAIGWIIKKISREIR